jgi:hypothetical protein
MDVLTGPNTPIDSYRIPRHPPAAFDKLMHKAQHNYNQSNPETIAQDSVYHSTACLRIERRDNPRVNQFAVYAKEQQQNKPNEYQWVREVRSDVLEGT